MKNKTVNQAIRESVHMDIVIDDEPEADSMPLASEIIADQEQAERCRLEIMNLLYMMDIDQLKAARNAVVEVADREQILKSDTMLVLHDLENEQIVKHVYYSAKAARVEEKNL